MTHSIGRNDPCPCGSGRKHKKCCMTKPTDTVTETADDSTYKYSHHVVAFIDLLGQRRVFDDFEGIPSDETGKAELLTRLQDTVGYIRTFRENFTRMFTTLQADRPVPSEVPPQHYEEHKRLRKSAKIHLQSFSDSVIAWSPILTPDDLAMAQAINSIYSIMMVTATQTLISLGGKHPLRGGIDVNCGIQIEPGGNEIYGKALNSAYSLEQQAESPRVLIGPGILKLLSTVEASENNSIRFKAAKIFARHCRELITTDTDNRVILHFLGPAAREIMNSPKFKDVGIRAAYAFVKDCTSRFESDEKLGPRYANLLRYFKRNITDWNI